MCFAACLRSIRRCSCRALSTKFPIKISREAVEYSQKCSAKSFEYFRSIQRRCPGNPFLIWNSGDCNENEYIPFFVGRASFLGQQLRNRFIYHIFVCSENFLRKQNRKHWAEVMKRANNVGAKFKGITNGGILQKKVFRKIFYTAMFSSPSRFRKTKKTKPLHLRKRKTLHYENVTLAQRGCVNF